MQLQMDWQRKSTPKKKKKKEPLLGVIVWRKNHGHLKPMDKSLWIDQALS